MRIFHNGLDYDYPTGWKSALTPEIISNGKYKPQDLYFRTYRGFFTFENVTKEYTASGYFYNRHHFLDCLTYWNHMQPRYWRYEETVWLLLNRHTISSWTMTPSSYHTLTGKPNPEAPIRTSMISTAPVPMMEKVAISHAMVNLYWPIKNGSIAEVTIAD